MDDHGGAVDRVAVYGGKYSLEVLHIIL